jgi:AcrR family transcriptional regulator
MPPSNIRKSPRGEATREAMVSTAAEIFARDGFHASSTREIAAAAHLNPALIGFHFRDKQGLYLATINHIALSIRNLLMPIIEKAEKSLSSLDDDDRLETCHARLVTPLMETINGIVALMARDDTATWAQLILREQQAPTEAFAILYDQFMGRLFEVLTNFVTRLRPNDSLASARLTAITICGQTLIFRTGRAGVLRHMGWSKISPAHLRAIQRQIYDNVTAQLRIPT